MISFSPTLSPALEWLPDESLFSLCSRYHHLTGHHTSARSCLMLFGSARTGSAHDVPARVQSLVDRCPGLGSAVEIVMQRTLLPFYFPFHGAQRCENWIAQVSDGAAPSLKAQLGLAASRFGASHPLKACPQCLHRDVDLYGVAYWHLQHQLPGSLYCVAHGEPLQAATEKVSGQDRFGWLLPTQAQLRPAQVPLAPHADALQLCLASKALQGMPISFSLEGAQLSRLYRSRLIELELLEPNSEKINHRKFDLDLCAFIVRTGLAAVWPWLIDEGGLPSVSSRLLRLCQSRHPRESHHPINHLILMHLLFGSWNTFWQSYQSASQGDVFPLLPKEKRSVPQAAPRADGFAAHEQLLKHIRNGFSVTRSAALCGVAVATAMSWAAKAGISSSVRPKALQGDRRSRLIGYLLRGAEKDRAASKFNVSVQTVTRVLMTEPGLHDQWVASRFSKAQAAARTSWQRAVGAFPHNSSNIWRNLEPAAYAWLYRNDRAWLLASIQSRTEPIKSSPFRRDWSRRDEELSQLVRTAALAWTVDSRNKRLTLAELCASTRGLRQMLSAMRKLPRTQAAIQEACASQRRPAQPPAQGTLEESSGGASL